MSSTEVLSATEVYFVDISVVVVYKEDAPQKK